MAVRALPGDVQKMVDNTHDSVDLYITQANAVVDDQLLSSGLSDKVLALIETYLAAHFATLSTEKGALAEKGIGEAREKYHNIYKGGLSATRFGQQAMMFDSSGKLATISSVAENTAVRKASFTVVGSPDT